MPHVASDPEDIARRVLGRFTALTGASTANLNGDLATLTGLFAEELSLIDRLFTSDYVMAQWLEGDPELVLQVLEGFPLRFPKLQEAKAAFGGAFEVTRADTSTTETYSPGDVVVFSQNAPDIFYQNTEEFEMESGTATVTNVQFIAQAPGESGTALAGTVRSVAASRTGNIIVVRNTADLIGRSAETAAEGAERAKLWLRSLAAAQAEALESTAYHYVDPDGDTVVSAAVSPHPEVRGFSYLHVDNGAAMAGYVVPAEPTYGKFSELAPGQRHRLKFSGYPAATPPQLVVGGTTFTAGSAWTCLDEQGDMWLAHNASAYGIDTSPGTPWIINGYTKYKGLIAGLQRHINRYNVAAGNRVAVVPARPRFVVISGIVVTESGLGYTRRQLLEQCRSVAVAFVRSRKMGAPVLMSDLNLQLRRVEGVINFIPDQQDLYPGGPFHKCVLLPSQCNFR